MGLLRFFKKADPVSGKGTNLADDSTDMEHLTPDGDLPFGWFSRNKEFIELHQTEYTFFLNAWIESRNSAPRDQMNTLASFIQYMNDVKRLCTEKGECFEYWRETLFADDYLSERTSELQCLRKNIAALTDKYDMDQRIQTEIVPALNAELQSIIHKNPDILQTDVYKMYAPEVKQYISEALYYMEKSNTITRTKQGRTYALKAN